MGKKSKEQAERDYQEFREFLRKVINICNESNVSFQTELQAWSFFLGNCAAMIVDCDRSNKDELIRIVDKMRDNILMYANEAMISYEKSKDYEHETETGED